MERIGYCLDIFDEAIFFRYGLWWMRENCWNNAKKKDDSVGLVDLLNE